jgi:hypothetical protein
MAIDPSIALRVDNPNLGQVMLNSMGQRQDREFRAQEMDFRRQQFASEQEQQQHKEIAEAARWADTPQKWEQALDWFERKGENVTPFRGRYDLREKLLQQMGAFGEYVGNQPKPASPTAMQQNYEFLNSQDPALGKAYLQRQTSEPPMIANNGDGTFTIIPRSQQAPAAEAGPQPGQVEDGYRFKGGNPADPNSWEPVQGGPTPQASGTFQP